MVVLGIDAHKRTHTVVAVDAAGRQLGTRVTRTTSTAAHLELVRWAGQFGADRSWAVEDCRHLSRRLEADLLAAGEQIVRVPPKLMAHARDSARTYGKSDPIDALAAREVEDMKIGVKILKGTELVLLRAIQTVITLGLFWRFHWVTRQIRAIGGRHAGILGMIYVHLDGERLVASRMLSKTLIALRQIAVVDRAWFPWMGVQIDTTGSRNLLIPTWTPRALAEYIEAAAIPSAPAADLAARAA